jgi:cytochrome o ubiquinol oxidase operon protein cyoD
MAGGIGGPNGASEASGRRHKRNGRRGASDHGHAHVVHVDGGALEHSAGGDGPGGAGGDGHGDGDGGAHLTLRGYATGFFAAVFLTAIPFLLVMGKTFGSSNTTAAVILAFAAVQIVVHMVYFLHMSPKSEGGWNLLALLFTIMLVVITLSGSLWVMYHLNHNMMPDSMMNMHNMP